MDCFTNTTDMACPVATTIQNGDGANEGIPLFTFAYILIPILLIEFLMSVFANVVLMILIVRSYESLTTLNVFLFSLAIIGLVLSINQTILMGLIFYGDRPIPSGLCRFTYVVQSLGSYGLTFLQLAISYNRYRTSLNPIHWESSLRKAYISVGVIWMVTLVVTALLSVLHIAGIHGEVRYCFWPSFDQHITFKLTLHVLLFFAVAACVVLGAYYHRKTLNLLNTNRLALVREMEMTTDIQYYENGHVSPEKTSKSLVVVFGIQMATLLVPFAYDMLRMLIIAFKLRTTGDVSDPSPTVFLLFLTTWGLFTTTSPFFLMLVSTRFKRNVASIFKRKHMVGCKGLRELRLEKNTPSTPTVHKETTQRRVVPQPHDVDLSIFMDDPSVKYRAYKQQREDEDKFQFIDELKVDERNRDGAKTSMGHAAVRCGLMLATASHSEAVGDFFMEERKEATQS